jgi:hypothetical protein
MWTSAETIFLDAVVLYGLLDSTHIPALSKSNFSFKKYFARRFQIRKISGKG